MAIPVCTWPVEFKEWCLEKNGEWKYQSYADFRGKHGQRGLTDRYISEPTVSQEPRRSKWNVGQCKFPSTAESRSVPSYMVALLAHRAHAEGSIARY